MHPPSTLARGRLAATLAVVAVGASGALTVASAQTRPPCSAADPGGAWPSYGHDWSNTRTQPLERGLPPSRAARLAPAWTFTTKGALQSTPVVGGGCAYLTTSTGDVYAVSTATGRQAWHVTLPVVKPASLGGAIPGAPALVGGRLYVLVSDDSRPFAVALDAHTGRRLWRSRPVTTQPASYTNASAAVADGVVVFGYSPAEGSDGGQGGVALLDPATGRLLADVPTIPPADQRKGYAGGGIWDTAAFDRHGYAYVGAGNPDSKTVEHPHTNAILKIDVDRARPTFGRIVASYKGQVDQYDDSLQTLSRTPACAASDTGMQWPLDDPACGQLDLDFGASPNLFPDGRGGLLVGELQKSGDFHVAHTADMSPAWHTVVGATCAACNAASTAYDGRAVFVISTPGGLLWSLDARTGARRWVAAVADGVHYQSLTVADGVVYTVDGNGFLDAWATADGSVVLKRSLSADAGAAVAGMTSTGVAVADHLVLAAGSDASSSAGYLVGYRAG